MGQGSAYRWGLKELTSRQGQYHTLAEQPSQKGPLLDYIIHGFFDHEDAGVDRCGRVHRRSRTKRFCDGAHNILLCRTAPKP